jgi:tetratricopeptide (TPR) repeat protein
MKHLALVALLLAVDVAEAQPKKVDAAALKKASNHFKLGQEFFKSGQWDRAIAEYQQALDLTGEPLMVFNIALAHDRAGRAEQALEGYRKYLEEGPDGAIADEARGYVAKLTPVVDALKKQRADEEQRKAFDAKRAQEDAARQAEAARLAEEAKRNQGERARQADAVEARGKTQRLVGLALVGTGALVAGYGAKRGLDARVIASELEDHTGSWTDAQIARDQEGRSANTQMIVFTAVGAGVAITGAVFYVIGRGAPSHAEKLRVQVTPSGGQVSATFRF